MAAATKKKRFQWNKGDKTLFRRANIFPPTPIWNIFPYHTLPPLVRAPIYNPDQPALSTNSASLVISSLSLQIRLSSWEICSQIQVSLQFHHLLGCNYPKKLKIERREKAKLWEKQCTYFHDSCSRRHFDSRAISTRAEVRHLIATSWPRWNSLCNQALNLRPNISISPNIVRETWLFLVFLSLSRKNSDKKFIFQHGTTVLYGINKRFSLNSFIVSIAVLPPIEYLCAALYIQPRIPHFVVTKGRQLH